MPSFLPTPSTKKPVTALANVLGRAMSDEKRANCVAVKFLLVFLDIKATRAAVPKPTPKYSNAMTKHLRPSRCLRLRLRRRSPELRVVE